MSKSKKVLFIVIDQLRADCLTGALSKHVNLPNLDALRADAVSFQRHYTVTSPCGPARASILTGQYTMNHRSARNGAPLANDKTNIAREARKAGYEPMLFGYTDTSLDPRTRHPKDPDLSTYEQVMPGFAEKVEMRLEESLPWRAHLKSKGYDTPEYEDFYNPVSSRPGEPPRPDDPAFYAKEDSDTAFLTDEFLKSMSVRQNQNWFAHLTYIRPHPPLVAPEPYNKMYKGKDLPLPVRSDDLSEVHPFLDIAPQVPPMESFVKGCDHTLDSRSDEDVQTLRAIYLGLATEVDHHVGRVMAFLKETGQYDDTLIVVTADHGEMLGDHRLWGKQHVYDPAYHVSLIIRDPDQPAQHGTEVALFSESVDVTPTILDWIGLPVPPSMDGVSLLPLVQGDTPHNWRKHVHMELDFGEPGDGTRYQNILGLSLNQSNLAILREDRFKLVHFNGGLPPLLFDLENDPHEMVNLAEDPAHTATLLRLTQQLLSHRMQHMDHTLSNLTTPPAS